MIRVRKNINTGWYWYSISQKHYCFWSLTHEHFYQNWSLKAIWSTELLYNHWHMHCRIEQEKENAVRHIQKCLSKIPSAFPAVLWFLTALKQNSMTRWHQTNFACCHVHRSLRSRTSETLQPEASVKAAQPLSSPSSILWMCFSVCC